MLRDFKTEIKLLLIVVLIAVVISVAGILLLKTPQPTPPTQQPLGDTSDEVDVDKNSSSVRFSGEVVRGQIFEKEIGQELVFRLIPGSGGIDWTISIGDKTDAASNFAGVVTPPYRGINYIYIEGWHFRNSDNSGPNEIGPKNVNAPGEVREFFFVTNKIDAEEAARLLDKILWPGDEKGWEEFDKNFALHEAISKGEGSLTITDMKLGNLTIGEQAWIEEMKFEVELIFPEDSQQIDTLNWQTYRNDEFGFEFKYPPDWRQIGEIIMPASYVERCEDVLSGQKDFNGCLWLGSVAASENPFSYGSAETETTIQKFIEDFPQERIGARLFYVFHDIFEGVGTNTYFTKGPDQKYYRILYWQRYPVAPYQNYDYDENLQGILHQILSTFRFVE